MFKKLNLLLILLLAMQYAQAQVQQLNTEVASLSAVQRLDLPPLNNNQLLKQYTQGAKEFANRFAEARDVNINPDKDGTWEATKSGVMVWRQIVKSPGAHTINLGFTEFKLAESAQLYIYNSDYTEVLGPFTAADNDDHMQLWTPIIEGDEVVLELQILSEDIKKNDLQLSRVNHDFKDVRKSMESGSCNLDVICSAADGWGIVDNYRDIISAVGAYSFNGIDQCSGVLINNARNDCTPYFLTAEHCGISNSNAPSVVVYWNYQNSYCRQPNSPQSGATGDGNRSNFNSGAVIRAEFGSSDFTLIELDDPLDTNLDLYLAGWNIERTLPDTSICIHHPGVQEKRISFEFNRLDYDPSGNDTTHLLVNDWDIGTTEGGSSGSPIFNTKKQIIGQLTGGLAACGNNEYDSFGWMRRSWTGAGNLQNSLKPWLDPDNTGVTQIQGRSCNYSVITDGAYYDVCGLEQDSLIIEVRADGLFDAVVNYSFSGLPTGLIASFDFDSGPTTMLNRLTVRGFSSLSGTDFSFNINATDGSNGASTTISVNFNAVLPIQPQITKPANGASNISLNPTLQVMRNQAKTYFFELSEDAAFSQIVFTKESTNYFVKPTNLKENTTYYWRAKTSNICGDSGWSSTASFTTASVYCTHIYSMGDPIEISSSSPNSIQSGIVFPYGVIIEDVNISNIEGQHDYIEDLIFTLEYEGKSAVLMGEVCGDNLDFNLGFDDQANDAAIPCPPTDGLLYKPETPLNIFNGTFAGGIWDLDIEDTAFLDGGQLNEWSMEVCFSNPALSVIVPRDHRNYNCNNSPSIEAFIYATEPDWDIVVKDMNSNIINTDHTASSTHISAETISFLDKSQLNIGKNQLVLELVNPSHTQVLAFSVIELFVEAEIGKALINVPAHQAKLRPEDLTNISWSTNYTGDYIVEIASDANFKDVIWSASGSNKKSVPMMNMLAEGIYFLRVILVSGDCLSYSQTTRFEITEMLVATEEPDRAELVVYPNPTHHNIIIAGELGHGDVVSIYDLKGSVILQTIIDKSVYRWDIDLTLLPKGIYIITVDQGINRFREKVVKL